MAVTSSISRRYATALVDSLASADIAELSKAASELERFAQVLTEAPDAQEVLVNPVFGPEEKQKVLAALSAKLGLSDTVARFLRHMLERDRGGYIVQTAELVRNQANERAKKVRAEVESAGELNEATLENLKRALERRTGRVVELDVRVNPELLGGIRAVVGSTVFDGSLRSQLEQLKETLKRT